MKKIIQLASIAVLLTMVTSCCGNCKQDECKLSANKVQIDKSTIGLQLYSLRDDINSFGIDSVITAVGKMGYKFIEAANYGDGKFYGMTPEEFKSKLETAGLTAMSSHTGRSLPDDPSTANWDEIWAWWDQAIAAHKAAGMKYIVTPGMPTPPTLDGLKIYCDYYNQIGEKCKANGMMFGYHNHDYEFNNKIEDRVMLEYMIENTNPELVCFELDVYWAVMGKRGPVELFQKYPGRFGLLHIKDHKELGESGMIGFDAIFRYLSDAGTKYLVVEVEQYNYAPQESVKQSLDYLTTYY